jgi:hypothetical protein
MQPARHHDLLTCTCAMMGVGCADGAVLLLAGAAREARVRQGRTRLAGSRMATPGSGTTAAGSCARRCSQLKGLGVLVDVRLAFGG